MPPFKIGYVSVQKAFNESMVSEGEMLRQNA